MRREGGGRLRLSTPTPRFDLPTSSQPVPNSVLGALSTAKRLLIVFATLSCLVILFGTHRSEAASQWSGKFETSSKLQDWIPGSSHLFKTAQSKKRVIVHPIPKLMADAQSKFKMMVGGQSKTLAEAVKEYKRRYGRNPPKGFDEWFEFAKENGVKIIDEYDRLVQDLEPFWGMSGEELRRRALQVRGCVVSAIRRRLKLSLPPGWALTVYRPGTIREWKSHFYEHPEWVQRYRSRRASHRFPCYDRKVPAQGAYISPSVYYAY